MKQNEKKGKKESYKKNQVMEMKIKTKLKQNEDKNKMNKVKKWKYDLVAFTEEILNEKLHFLCRVYHEKDGLKDAVMQIT